MLKIKDSKAFIFYFLMSIIFLDFGNQVKKLSYIKEIEAIDNPVFKIVHVNNTGSAFSLLSNHCNFLAVFGILVLLLILFYVLKNLSFKKDKFILLSAVIFTGGTLGNLLERIRFGYVIDYIKLNFINFPVFNAFDIMICTGIFLYIIFILFSENVKK